MQSDYKYYWLPTSLKRPSTSKTLKITMWLGRWGKGRRQFNLLRFGKEDVATRVYICTVILTTWKTLFIPDTGKQVIPYENISVN